MMKIILSTANIIGGGPSIVRKTFVEKSNAELTTSLRMNILEAQKAAQYEAEHPQANGTNGLDHSGSAIWTNGFPLSSLPNGNGVNGFAGKAAAAQKRLQTTDLTPPRPSLSSWTTKEGEKLYIPSIDWSLSGLAEERSQYDITLKLFFLPSSPRSQRRMQTQEAIAHVLKELGVQSVDLLIVSFPGVEFDSANEDEDKRNGKVGCGGGTASAKVNGIKKQKASKESDPEDEAIMLETWNTLETLHSQGVIAKLGVAEFGSEKLAHFLPKTRVKPSVDQINVQDCCTVPRRLIEFTKKEGIELLTHNDCTNILPRGTVRDLLGSGENGAGVLADPCDDDEDHDQDSEDGVTDQLAGDIEPQWVVKYTAVIKDRGVIENKGYFAAAELNGLSV
ncbi:MAG: hypothetical protein M1829_003129 [Trizodia sp. TS-e1964]|nr:MAG: hypothetical protein M1829_003129 [Trizodia sp. TS-e1964]